MQARDLMTTAIVTCGEDTSLGEAARIMWDHDIGFLPVISHEGALAGVITDRDVCMAAWLQNQRVSEIAVRTAMSPQVATCRPDSDISDVERIMRKLQVHRIPVVDPSGALVGVISLNDLALRSARDSDHWLEENVAETLAEVAAPRGRSRRNS